MPKGNALLFGGAQIGVLGKCVKHARIESRELAFAQGDADQQRGGTFGDGLYILLHLRRELHDAEWSAPACIGAVEVAFHDELAMAGNDNGMDVPVRPLGEELIEPA